MLFLTSVEVERHPQGRIPIIDTQPFGNGHCRVLLRDKCFQLGEVGIAVHKDYRRQGYASDALQLLCEYAFDFLSLTQLYAHVATDNEVCMKLFTSCGFVQCGLLKDWLQVGGCYKDAAIFQYLNPKRH